MKFYEIYVAGKNGFSTFVKTDLIHHDEDEILNLAVSAKVIEAGDAKDICYGAGYVEEREEKDSEIWHKI
jgi:hypothetical protein